MSPAAASDPPAPGRSTAGTAGATFPLGTQFCIDAGSPCRIKSALRYVSLQVISEFSLETFDVSRLNSDITCKLTYLKADLIRHGDPASMQNCVPNGNVAPAVPAVLRPGAGGSLAAAGDIRRIQLENQVRAFAE